MKKTNYEVSKLIEYPREGILSKELVKSKEMDVTLFCMAKGAELSEHTSTKEGTVHVVEGEGIFTLKEKKIKMRPGIFIFMEKNAIHALKAKKNTSFILTLV